MYKITTNDGTVYYSETAVYIKLAANGCYKQCAKDEAEGVCVKTPVSVEGDAGNLSKTVSDTVFKTRENGLHGTEPSAEVEELLGAVALADADEIVNILLGGTE